MANSIASNIFKQLIYYPESALGVLQADAGTGTLTQPGSYTSVNCEAGEDELKLNFSSTSTSYPMGTKVTIAGKVYVTLTDLPALVATSRTLILDRPVEADVTAILPAAITYVAPFAYTPKTLRRVSSNLDLKKETYSSNEVRSDQQIADQRTGANTVDGSISGELSSYTYDDFIGALLRRDFTTGSLSTAITFSAYSRGQVAGVENLYSKGTLTYTLNDVEAAKLKTGDVLTLANADSAINNKPLLIIEKTTTTIVVTAATDPESLVFPTTLTNLSGVTFKVLGKKTWVPTTNHTKKSFTFEHYYKDVSDNSTGTEPVSELFKGVRVTQGAIKMPSSGLATIDLTVMGTAMQTPSQISTKLDGTALTWAKTSSMLQQITGEAPQTSGIDSIYSAAVGSVYIRDKKTGGTVTKVGLITSLDLTINGNGQTLKVIGSTSSPDVTLGKIQVSGNMSIYFTDTKFRDMFINEDEASIIAIFTENAGNDINNSFMSFVMPRIKTGGASKDDAESIVMSVPFTALVGDGSNGFEATTLMIQDYSQLA
jgi:hypothetical protein